MFAQSVILLTKLWTTETKNDDNLYSAIVYGTGNYSIKEEIFVSLPVKFENGEYLFVKNYSVNGQIASIIEEIVRVNIFFDNSFDFYINLKWTVFFFYFHNRTQKRKYQIDIKTTFMPKTLKS